MLAGENNDQATHRHHSTVCQRGHQFRNLHKIVTSPPTGQKASPSHGNTEHSSDILEQQQHQQQQASETYLKENRVNDYESNKMTLIKKNYKILSKLIANKHNPR